jgi:CRP-like cAMP-binding protein
MSNDPKVDRLQGTPLFSGCDKKALGRLAAAIDIVDVEAGRTLIKQGSIHHEAFIIESGEADVLVDNEIVATIPAGEMIGEIGLLVRGPGGRCAPGEAHRPAGCDQRRRSSPRGRTRPETGARAHLLAVVGRWRRRVHL